MVFPRIGVPLSVKAMRYAHIAYETRLTFMSIRDEIRYRQQEGRLHLLRLRAPRSSIKRPLFVTSPLWGRLNGPWSSKEETERWNSLWADLERFVEGRLIDPNYLIWLAPRQDLLFEIRSVQPRPSLRVFCRFAEPDILIATNYAERTWLEGRGSPQWRIAINEAKAIWRQLFPSYDPCPGSSIRDFITENVADDAPFSRGGSRRPRPVLSSSKAKKPSL